MPQPSPVVPVSQIDLEHLERIEEQALDDVRKIRRHERRSTWLQVALTEGWGEGRTVGTGYIRNLSLGGCRSFVPVAPEVGETYVLSIQSKSGDQALRARCLRCTLVSEGVFDSGWEFQEALTIDLPAEE
ncbi:MAG: PilZ domain-containing protein [bacterium]|nr:PilZ domain-containing protein [bacterium]